METVLLTVVLLNDIVVGLSSQKIVERLSALRNYERSIKHSSPGRSVVDIDLRALSP